MSILIKEGNTKRDWTKLAGATAETAFKSLTLGKDGFAAAISPLLRIFESLRGQDSTERRATRLILETVSYSIAKAISSVQLKRPPLQPELESITNHLLARIQTLSDQNEIMLRASHLEHPSTFQLFDDVAVRIFHELKLNEPMSQELEVAAVFRAALTEGLSRIRSRSPDYYAPVFEVLSGPNALGDAKSLAWQEYRRLLIRRFEDEPLFGEDRAGGVRLGQAYQGLRGFWNEEEPEAVGTVSENPRVTRHIRMLDAIVMEWLESHDSSDRIRLISGGPGSGKSTFAKSLAATLAVRPEWRVIFVPLQRLKGVGPLESRINDYFRLQGDESFDVETAPLLSMGRDGHRDWLIIFDGLDELAKEGPGSESAAQDFASALADWRGRIGLVAVRFLVLGRAPSMQEARRRLSLQGRGTLHVAGMAPLSKLERGDNRKISYNDPLRIREIDQRPEFWGRWAVASGLPIELPEAMRVDELLDLTNEPLLAYLLILSGYVSDRWREAAENRNRIYQAIFNHIWIREREKPTRIHLNDLGQEGFEALLQALGLAAWRGGGRTGDEATFMAVRDNFMRPDLLARAKSGGTADLSNVALLFYTRRDEEGGRGYEFLHKSFGEYLTARGLFSAFSRWGSQADDPTLDFNSTEFLRRWLRVAGPTPLTREIIAFLRNEVRLWSSIVNVDAPWDAARGLLPIAQRLMDHAIKDGLPAHELGMQWRPAESHERHGEQALMAVVDALARASYPMELLGMPLADGGWSPGPVELKGLMSDGGLSNFMKAISGPSEDGYFATLDMFIPIPALAMGTLFSRLSFRNCKLFGLALAGFDLQGCSFENASMTGSVIAHSNLAGSSFKKAELEYTKFYHCVLSQVDFSSTKFMHTEFDKESRSTSSLSDKQKRQLTKKRGK